MPNINHYDAFTGFYTHTSEAQQDPCEPSRWLVPAFSSMKSLQEPRDGLVNRYNAETKAFELVEAPVVVKDQEPALDTEQAPWMVGISKRPAKIIAEGSSYCNYICMCGGFPDQNQLEFLAERFDQGDTSPIAERASRFMAWRVECLSAVSDLAAGVRSDSAVYPPSMADLIAALPKPPEISPVEAGQAPAGLEHQANGQ